MQKTNRTQPNTENQENFNKNLKLYSRLSEIQSHCDRREIKVGVSIREMMTHS